MDEIGSASPGDGPERREGPEPGPERRPGSEGSPGTAAGGRSPVRVTIAAAMILAGAVWILQGLGILTAGDSFMIGDPTWVVIGAAAVVLGIWLGLRRS